VTAGNGNATGTPGAKAPASSAAPSPVPAKGAPGSSPSGAPSPSAIPGAAGDSSPSAAPGGVSEEGSAPKTRGKTGIPGVHTDPAGDSEFGGEAEPVVTGLQRAVKGAEAATEKTEGEVTPPAAPEAAPGTLAAPEAPKQKFKLGDLEFDDEAQAVHAHKSLRGQAASVAQKARDLAAQQQALVSALAQVGMSLDAEGKVVRAPAPAASSPATPSAPPKSAAPTGSDPVDLGTDEGVRTFLDSALNWKQLPTLIKTYEDQHGVTLGSAVAMRLVMETILPKLWKEMAGHTSSALQPLQNHIGEARSAQAVQSLFSGMGEYVYPDGSPAYPELLSPETATQVYQVWHDLGQEGVPVKFLLSPKGVQLAISLYRDFNGIKAKATGTGSAPSSSTAPPAPQAGGNVDQATAAVRSVMQSIESARGSVSPDLATAEGQPFRPSGEENDRASQIRRAIRDSRGKEVIPGVRFS
jgi:hypothetical protein